jgi:hypothetical protein
MRIRAISLLVASTFAAYAPTILAQTADTARIDRMTLSSGGVAEVHRTVDVDGDGVLRIEVPVAQVDDILKSLLVQDPNGKVESVTLDGPAPVQEAFATLPFAAETLGSLPDLLKSLPGTRVRATSGGRSIEGAVLGTATVQRKEASGETTPSSTLSVLTDDRRVDTLRLGADAAVEILDAAMRDRFAAAVTALGKAGADQVRTISVAVKGTGKRSVGVDYVSAAPVWKPAFRLILGKPGHARLQGWAVLENASGQDWQNVDLTLMSGAPVTLTQKLYEHYWRERQELPVFAGASDAPRADTSAAYEARSDRRAMAKSSADMAEPPSPPMQAMPAPVASAPMGAISEPAVAAVAQESMTNVSFRLPKPVSLGHGQTLSLPFTDADVPAERLAVFQPEMGSQYPVSAVMLKNTTGSSLPPGILTVYDADSGFTGDAQMPALPPGEERLASFAADRKVEISAETKPEERVTSVMVSNGILNAQTQSRRVTTYTIKGAADAPRTVIIEHPKLVGWTTQSPQLDSTTATHQRLRAQVAAGAVVKVEATDQRTRTTAYTLANADAQALLVWSNAPVTPELSSKLKQLAQARTRLAEAERAITDIEAKLTAQAEDQARLRENLGAVPQDSELGRRYLDLMAASENTIATLAKQREQATAARDAQKDAFGKMIAGL